MQKHEKQDPLGAFTQLRVRGASLALGLAFAQATRQACAALCAVVALALTAPTHAQCLGDIDASGQVDGSDMSFVLSAWGTPGQGSYDSDLNNDGLVSGEDLTLLLSAWGPCAVVPAWATLIETQPDPAVVTDSALRAAIIASGRPWRVLDTATQIEMVLIPPGTFQMGCSASGAYACNSDENPVHTVTLTNAFYMGRYEVTQAQWQARMGSNPSWFQSASSQVPADQVPNRPVEQVSWNTVQGFLAQTGMRLPTEAEREYAYRAGTTTAFHGYTGNLSGTNDDTSVGNIAWYGTNSNDQTRPVGGKLANGYGLYDMSGNVWEWVNDWYGSTYYSSSPQNNPSGPASGSYRVFRGGSRVSGTNDLRASDRHASSGYSSYHVGFRVARTP
jgi:formylglycine-generating enzyme required for sulfatase activity